MTYRFAGIGDIGLLASKRLVSLETDEADGRHALIHKNCMSYFQRAIAEQSCEAVIAEDNGLCIGIGIQFYYDSVPSGFNMTGKNAYISCMYVEPEFRRKGIGSELLKRLTDRASGRGYEIIMLNASEMGRSLYAKFGFHPIENGMVRKRQ